MKVRKDARRKEFDVLGSERERGVHVGQTALPVALHGLGQATELVGVTKFGIGFYCLGVVGNSAVEILGAILLGARLNKSLRVVSVASVEEDAGSYCDDVFHETRGIANETEVS